MMKLPPGAHLLIRQTEVGDNLPPGCAYIG